MEPQLELKDEELLDFDGSEYDFASDEEAADNNAADLPPPVGSAHPRDVEMHQEHQHFHHKRKEGAESGEIRQDDEKPSGGDVDVERDRHRRGSKHEPRPGRTSRKHGSTTKAELEDGELIDMVNSKKQQGDDHGVSPGATTVKDSTSRRSSTRRHLSGDTTHQRSSSDREITRNSESRHDRKRSRRDHGYDDRDRDRHHRDRKEPYEGGRLRHERSYGSPDRHHDDFSDPRTRGGNRDSRHNFGPNFSPGIMGPGRPQHRPLVHPSLEASLGRFPPAPRFQAQLQEMLAQEYLLRSQQMMQLARLGVRPPRPIPPIYPPMVGPYIPRHPPPMWGSDAPLNGLRPLGRGPRSLAVPGPLGADAMSQRRSRSGPGVRGEGGGYERAEGSRHFSKQGSAEKSAEKTAPPDGNATDNRIDPDVTSASKGASNESAAGYNIIQLGGPVQKSRVLTVSGLQEDTPLSAVAEAFEKQGRVKDFQKSVVGDVFTVTYESVHEALSAKRHLHRSVLCGRQITVEFA